MAKFKEILFDSSYTCRKNNSAHRAASNRADCQIDAGNLLYQYVIKNKFRKIIDFGTWSGGSAICQAQGLQELADRTGLRSEINPFERDLELLIAGAHETVHDNKTWHLYNEDKKPEFVGTVKVYDKFWDDSDRQTGRVPDVLNNIKNYDCFWNVQFSLVKADIWDWIKNPEPFDLLHADVGNRPEKILKIVNALEKQINDGGVVLFNGGAIADTFSPFGERISPDGVDISAEMVHIGHPDNYEKLKRANLDIQILTQEYPGFICVDRRNKMPWPAYMNNFRKNLKENR